MARSLGMTLHLPHVQPRSRKALEAAEFAREKGVYGAMHTALFKASFEDGRDIGDWKVLLEVGESAGLDRGELRAVLEESRHAQKVLADEELARRLGVESVPTMLIGPADAPLEASEAISGAQPCGGRLEAAVEHALPRLQSWRSRKEVKKN